MGVLDRVSRAGRQWRKENPEAFGFDKIQFVKMDVQTDDEGKYTLNLKAQESVTDEEARGLLHAMASSMCLMLGPADNYVESSIYSHRAGGEYVMTIRRGGKPTPHDKRKYAQGVFLDFYEEVAACEPPEESQLDEVLARFQTTYETIKKEHAAHERTR